MPALNLGVVAHVDAGKTTLTERLLFEAGVIDRVGRVDHGDTRTDTDVLERRRGITIRSAVAAFAVDGVRVNLVDTPGHSDFVAEVERALAVLDAVILVVSAVEGVQPQTRVLIGVLERLRLPFVVFANKIDRAGARYAEMLAELDDTVSGEVVALTEPVRLGTRAVGVRPCTGARFRTVALEKATRRDDDLLRRYVDGAAPPSEAEIRTALARLTARSAAHPVFAGSALAGVGVAELLHGLPRFLPAGPESSGGRLHAAVFKIEQRRTGRPVALVRVFDGTLAGRDAVTVWRRTQSGAVARHSDRPLGVATFRSGTTPDDDTPATAGDIAAVAGLADVRIADQLGCWDGAVAGRVFAPPALEAVIRARHPAERQRLFEALHRLDEQDPLLNVRLAGPDRQLTVSLYGEVQREVVLARLAEEFGIEAEFSPTRVGYVERVRGSGEATERSRPGNVTVGLRVEPGPAGGGGSYRVVVERGWLLPYFHAAIEAAVAAELETGPAGWPVLDAAVSLVDGRFGAPMPSPADFRQVAGAALRAAITRAGTIVCEPYSAFELDVPVGALADTVRALQAEAAELATPVVSGRRCRLTGRVATARLDDLERRLPSVGHGTAVLVHRPAGYRPVPGPAPRHGG